MADSEPVTQSIGGRSVNESADPSPSSLDAVREIGMATVLSRRYLIERAIGTGGTSTIFSALDRHRLQGSSTDAMVAVKVLLPAYRTDEMRIQRLIREFRYMQRLTHPGIARVFDLDCDDGVWFMTMELLHGESLSRHLHRQPDKRLETQEALRILIECSEALLCAHEHGVVHGDLKPGNVFIDAQGASHLLDFGSVPEQSGTIVPLHERFATPAYASPQILEGHIAEVRDDLFSLGCLAYQIFSGQHPFALQSSLDARDEGARLTWLPSIPARHFGVIARMLSWERDERPASAREFVDSLNAAQVRAKAAYAREPRPLPEPERSEAAAAADESAPADLPPSAQRESDSDSERRGRHAPTSEDIARAFAQFSGVVPDTWISADESQSRTASETTPEEDQPRVRWGKAIPHELIEPKPRIDAFQPSTASPPVVEPETTETEPTEEVVAQPVVKPTWRQRLSWLSLRPRTRERVEPVVAAAAAERIREPLSIASDSELREEPRSAPAPQLQWRGALPSSWAAIATRFRQWRPTTNFRVRNAALASATRSAAQPQNSGTPWVAPSSWTPQVRMEQRLSAHWPDLHLVPARVAAPSVRFDVRLLPQPVIAAANLSQRAEATSASAAIPVEPPAPEPMAATPEPFVGPHRPSRGRRILSAAAIRARRSGTYLLERWRAATVGAARVASSVSPPRISWRRAADVWPHWRELRKSIGSLSVQPRPQWREAMPVLTIAGLAFFAVLLLQLSSEVRSDFNLRAERDRQAEARLAALADREIAIIEPQIAASAVPVLPAAAVEASVPAASGVVSFQSRRVVIVHGQQMAAINLLRERSTAGAAPVRWSIAPGTAKPGVDYELPAMQTARFNDGQDVRTLFIPIKPSSSTRERRFTIRLRKTPGAPAFGEITETEVVLAGSTVVSVAAR